MDNPKRLSAVVPGLHIPEYGTGNFLKLNTSLFFEDHVLSASFRHSDGYFRNACSGKMADPYNGGSIQWRFERRLSGRMQLNNTLSASFSREGGFAYGRYDGESIAPVDCNDEGSYGRFTFREGIKLHYSGEVLNLSCITSFQLLSDDMRMDQDFTPESIFTLRQQQRSSAFTTELILQNRMMDGLMKDLGVYLDVPMVSVGAEHTKYAPEEAWNHELGFRYKNERGFAVSASVYHMDGRNQQITVFPSGKSTGRMMTNAGKSRSVGTETEISYARGRFQAHLSHGWCNARFMEYNDGNADYSGNRIPYSPEQTLYVSAAYRQPLNN